MKKTKIESYNKKTAANILIWSGARGDMVAVFQPPKPPRDSCTRVERAAWLYKQQQELHSRWVVWYKQANEYVKTTVPVWLAWQSAPSQCYIRCLCLRMCGFQARAECNHAHTHGCKCSRAGRAKMSVPMWARVENKVERECVQSFFSPTHTLPNRQNYSHTTGLAALLHLSYSNLKLIFSHSYLPKPTHISPAVSLHFLLSTSEKWDQSRSCFEIKYESS